MCGIVGFVDKRNKLIPVEQHRIIESMLKRIEHRGRDGEGVFVKERIAFGHTRLSIIDVSTTANQPFISNDGSLVLAYNGEIYNYFELDRILRKTHHYRTNCDTETLLRAYEEWGNEVVKKIQGMFAFSLFNTNRQTILLAADRFSIKPLYYVDTGRFFAWASEAKALLELPDFIPTFNLDSLPEFLMFRQYGGCETPWKEIKRLLPAHTLEYHIETGKIIEVEYWKESQEIGRELGTDQELFQILKRAVERHLIADVPVGLQLSGGLDSSLIASLACKIKTQQFHTFSIGLKDKDWNEFNYSMLVAAQIGSMHHELVFSEDDFCRLLPFAIYQHDEPLSHSHSIPILILSSEARKFVKVLLSGEGADELFGGYRRYQQLFNAPQDREIQIGLSAFNHEDEMRIVFPKLGHDDFSYRRSILEAASDLSYVEQVLALDRKTYLQSLLIRQDKMGMAANLENRVPFLDFEVVTAALNLPVERKVTPNDFKIALKSAARNVLSPEIVNRKKCGFGLPVGDWLRHEHGLGRYLKLFSSSNSFIGSIANMRVLNERIDDHLSGKADHTELLWVAINLELWHRIFVQEQEHGTLSEVEKYAK